MANRFSHDDVEPTCRQLPPVVGHEPACRSDERNGLRMTAAESQDTDEFDGENGGRYRLRVKRLKGIRRSGRLDRPPLSPDSGAESAAQTRTLFFTRNAGWCGQSGSNSSPRGISLSTRKLQGNASENHDATMRGLRFWQQAQSLGDIFPMRARRQAKHCVRGSARGDQEAIFPAFRPVWEWRCSGNRIAASRPLRPFRYPGRNPLSGR